MDLIYRKSESTSKPSSLEIGKNTVFLRRNIVSAKRVDSDGNDIVFWTYEEAKLSHEEFNEYSNLMAAKNAINGANDSDNIASLIVSQENTDNNQLIIMEAIADLYEKIDNLSSGGTVE